ncbi:MAG: PstA family ABC transporter permease, partial [bacterium]
FAYALFEILLGPGTRVGISGAAALTVLMIPIVVRSSEEMLRIVPNELREASYALGVPKWLTILKVVLPTSIAGITTGIMLAIARVMGETAPLLIAAGFSNDFNFNLFQDRMQSLREKIKDPAAFISEERDLEMALLSYDLAIETHKRLSEVADTPYANVRKMASLNMVKAEMLSEAGRIDEAKAALKKVIEWLEPIFEQLDKEEIIKACLLLFRLKVYFKDFQGAGGLMKFMDNYDTEGKLNQESEEFKVLSVSQQALKKCYDDREEYSEDKLKTFHLPE